MAATDPANVGPAPGAPSSPVEEQLSHLFGSYKAEWLREQLFDLFTEPTYFPELKTPRPCVLVGGRGTGKTTVLRCLSYEGQFALTGKRVESIRDWPYYGMYYRVNTNRVTAFKGPEVTEDQWNRLFGHYINLELCGLVLRFLQWFELHSSGTQLSAADCEDIAASLHASGAPRDIKQLAAAVRQSKTLFEASINNIADAQLPSLSLQGAPIDTLMKAVSLLPQFAGKSFFFLLDEYENFEDYQQQVVNTLLKHAGHAYTFKIGVRELGWRRRTTLNPNEHLTSPADYVRVDITSRLTEQDFAQFAASVCNARLKRITPQVDAAIHDVSVLLPALSEEDEAKELGVDEWWTKLRSSSNLSRDTIALLERLPRLEAYFVTYWSESQRRRVEEVLTEREHDPQAWTNRYFNYRYASLFSLKSGKRGIRKYYAGWPVFVQLAAGNVRYLLELVDRSLIAHLQNGGSISSVVPYDVQTDAAQRVGQKNLSELEGISVQGAKLTKLLLGLGRVFQVMATQSAGHAPEVNQFQVKFTEERNGAPHSEVEQLLRDAVMHLALLRFPGSKLQDPGETRDYEYMVHPIFAPFFVFSHRRKRKMTIQADDLLGLVHNPKKTIAKVLKAQNRRVELEPLPDQLALFEGFYAGGA